MNGRSLWTALCAAAFFCAGTWGLGGCAKQGVGAVNNNNDPGVCGDGVIEGSEGCDDGNTSDGDGCSAECSVEPGWVCTGEPSDCAEVCGNGRIDAGEECDDGNTADGDGCSARCVVEPGWGCPGPNEPSICTPQCGDGLIVGEESCDDANTTDGDGCDSTCQVETGWTCSGEPSVCSPICGDGLIRGNEGCDDGNTADGNGCDSTCQVEPGWSCSGEPSACTPICGDGLLRGGEWCDDGNTDNGDGCDSTCQVESDCICTGEPSVCSCQGDCNDGIQNGQETGVDCGGPNCPACELTLFPSQILECGAGYLDEIDHNIGDGYALAPDDLRTGTCAPTACVNGGKTQFGMDVQFDLGLPGSITILSAELRIRGIPNNGDAGITQVYDHQTDQLVGDCTIDEATQVYGECVAVLDPSFIQPTVTTLYTDNNNPACYFVYDFLELTVTY